ncbi:subtilisin-like protein [Suhomyces tanzawaensis NRRL Y-17324]|uniref:Subtilisin-like protein n=1 Tax=Suhomyces tanzawaensis NRRL Y-17324 TaxID=984487 RepID=A0A1E4SP13_9ASCO|nr:subtilisin-like protein [Suhomyces tanzawaensis NRRL Y-17324]ODV81132.1 subtilisin-like protein [Suhomyces tanzawaensis NRRL Y-17324]
MLSQKLLAAVAVSLVGVQGLVIPEVDSLAEFGRLLENKLDGVKELMAHQVATVKERLQEQSLGKDQVAFGGQEPFLYDANEASNVASSDGSYFAPLFKAVKDIIPGQYIVVLHDDLAQEDIDSHHNWIKTFHQDTISTASAGGNLLNFFNLDTLKGYAGYFTSEMVNAIQKDPRVKFVEHDAVFTVNELEIQKDAPWGLSRISHRENTAPATDYIFDSEGGKGVTAYVVDTGIKVEHEDFEGRASWGSAVALPHLKVDGHGHGTHCAGVIGSKTYGIAKNVDLVAVGVMNLFGTGSTSDIIKGLEFVVNDHKTKVQAKTKGFKGSTINMSIGGGASEALDLAANAAVAADIHVAVAAGNEDADACQSSPARASGPITVGASNVDDQKASFSNWGSCVDIFAPGEDIESTFIWSPSAKMSGTSMASPHIAGLLSYYLSLYPGIDSEFSNGKVLKPADLKRKLIKYGTKGVIQNLVDGQSPNVLAFNGAGANLTDFWNLV